MGQYIFQHPKTGEKVIIIQKMTDNHVFIKDGITWNRVWINPKIMFDAIKIDPFSKKDFMRRTERKMTVGEMQDESKELSERRAQKAGSDPIKDKLFNDYQRKTGKIHPENKPKRVETKDFVWE